MHRTFGWSNGSWPSQRKGISRIPQFPSAFGLIPLANESSDASRNKPRWITSSTRETILESDALAAGCLANALKVSAEMASIRGRRAVPAAISHSRNDAISHVLA